MTYCVLGTAYVEVDRHPVLQQFLVCELLIVMGIALQALSHTLGGSDVKDFFSGLLLGLSIAEMLAGIAVIGKSLKRK